MNPVPGIASTSGVDPTPRIAGPGARSYAFVIDWHIRLLGALVWLVAGLLVSFGSLDMSRVDPGASFGYLTVLPAAAIYFLYHPIVELVMRGSTPGKRIAGVRVVRIDGALPGVGAILVRNVLRLIDSLPVAYCVGLAFTLLTERQVRIGDIAAGTMLVYVEATDATRMPVADATRDRPVSELLEVVRDLLDRWPSLRPETRQALARRLLATLDAVPAKDADDDLRRALDAVLHRPNAS